MSKPKVAITLEPTQGQSATFQLLAPPTKNDEAQAQISLLVRIRNDEAAKIVVTSVNFTVLFSDNSQPVQMNNPVTIPIEPREFGFWYNKVFLALAADTGLAQDTFVNQNIITSPRANILKVALKVRNFDEQPSKLVALRQHESPTPKKAYAFPAKTKDLEDGECWNGAGGMHGNSVDGCQLFALDLGVSGWESGSKSWNHLKPGRIGDTNDDHRIWRKEVYAMADGEVLEMRWDFPENDRPRGELTDQIKKLINEVGDGNGNFITIITGDEIHLYAHLEPHSIPTKFRVKGANVKKGDLLGKVGNSGSSSAPHLHIDVRKKRRVVARGDAKFILRPMPFADIHSIRSDKAKGVDPAAPWFKHTGHGLCVASWPTRCLIWPSGSKPS